MTNNMKSNLTKVKGLGSAKSGAHHWWHQRLTALFIVILTVWLVFFCLEVSSMWELSSIISVIEKPQNILMLSLLVTTSFYHSFLGMQIVIEDYITCRSLRLFLIVSVQLFSVITTAAFVVAAMYIMTL